LLAGWQLVAFSAFEW